MEEGQIGIGKIPAGFHMLYYGASEIDRHGFVFFTYPGDVIICEWDTSTELIKDHGVYNYSSSTMLPSSCSLSENTVERLCNEFLRGQLSTQLAEYPEKETLSTWKNLSGFIFEETL